MPDGYLMVFCTCPDEAVAERLGRLLVDQRLAACVNILPGLTSIYRWQGKTEQGREHLLLIKTRENLYSALEQSLRESHPYELPEIIAVPITTGLPEYFRWIDKCLEHDS